MATQVKLNIGCGTQPLDGFINCDKYPGEGVNVVFDVTGEWPFDDNSVDYVYSMHVLEHLPEPFNFFKEAWRVLKSSPLNQTNMYIRLPYGPSEAGVGDITHLRYYTLSSFGCLQPDYLQSSHNLRYDSDHTAFKIRSVHLRIHPKLRWLLKPVIRRWGVEVIPFLWGGYTEMIVSLQALKTQAEIDNWHKENPDSAVPYCRCIMTHEYEGRKLRPGEEKTWMYF